MSYFAAIVLGLLALAGWAGVSFLLWRKSEDGYLRQPDWVGGACAIHLAAGWIFWASIFGTVIGVNGIDPDYGSGEVDGYLYNVSVEGVLWKTWEAQIVIGETEADSMRWACSVGQSSIGQQLESLRGQKIKIRYRRWFRAPWSVGSTVDEVLEVSAEEVPDE